MCGGVCLHVYPCVSLVSLDCLELDYRGLLDSTRAPVRYQREAVTMCGSVEVQITGNNLQFIRLLKKNPQK